MANPSSNTPESIVNSCSLTPHLCPSATAPAPHRTLCAAPVPPGRTLTMAAAGRIGARATPAVAPAAPEAAPSLRSSGACVTTAAASIRTATDVAAAPIWAHPASPSHAHALPPPPATAAHAEDPVPDRARLPPTPDPSSPCPAGADGPTGELKATISTGLSGDRVACVAGALSGAEYPLPHGPEAPERPWPAPDAAIKTGDRGGESPRARLFRHGAGAGQEPAFAGLLGMQGPLQTIEAAIKSMGLGEESPLSQPALWEVREPGCGGGGGAARPAGSRRCLSESKQRSGARVVHMKRSALCCHVLRGRGGSCLQHVFRGTRRTMTWASPRGEGGANASIFVFFASHFLQSQLASPPPCLSDCFISAFMFDTVSRAFGLAVSDGKAVEPSRLLHEHAVLSLPTPQGLVLWAGLKCQWNLRCRAKYQGVPPVLDELIAGWASILWCRRSERDMPPAAISSI